MIHKNVNEKQNNSRLDQAATSLFEDFSRSQIQRWISQGNLLVNGEILKAKDKVNIGDEISLDPVFKDRVSWDGEDIPINILHEEICREVTISASGKPTNKMGELQVSSI